MVESMKSAMDLDEELLDASTTDPEVFGLLFDRHARAVHRFASRRVGAELAKDVTADTFRVAFERRDAFDPTRGGFVPWLFGIASNVLRNHRRVEERQLRRVPVDPLADDPVGSTDDRLDAAAAAPALARALLELGADDRDTLLLFAWTDLGYEGVAYALGIPIGTVGSRLTRARRIVREQLREAGWALDPWEEDR